jgi:hypothetical protein
MDQNITLIVVGLGSPIMIDIVRMTHLSKIAPGYPERVDLALARAGTGCPAQVPAVR